MQEKKFLNLFVLPYSLEEFLCKSFFFSFYHSRNSRRRGGGKTDCQCCSWHTEVWRAKRRHVLTPAFTQHAAVHYSTNLSAPTAESSRQHRRGVPKRPRCVTVIFDVWRHEWLIDWRRESEQHTLICMGGEKRVQVSEDEALCLRMIVYPRRCGLESSSCFAIHLLPHLFRFLTPFPSLPGSFYNFPHPHVCRYLSTTS